MSLPVVTPPATPLPSLATVDAVLALEWDTGDVAELVADAELLAASAAVRRWCGWHITPIITETRVLDGPGGRSLMLPTMRLVEVLAITETPRGLAQTPVVVDLTMCEATEKGWVYRAGCWTKRLAGISVQFRHGWAADEVPELAQLVVSMVARGFDNPGGVEQVSVGQVSMRFTRTEGATGPGYTILGGAVDPYVRPV